MDETESPYLAGLDLRGRRVVVVGGGSVAQRRLPLLLACGARVVVIARSATPAVEALADFGQIELELREYRPGDLDDAWYAIATTDDPTVNEGVVAEATAARVFCVRADSARDGTAVTPATAKYEGLTVGVLADGHHRRSVTVRNAVLDALEAGELTSENAVAANDSEAPSRGSVALVGGGPGDPDLITVRGRRLLAQADVVVADRLAPPELLAELGPDVEVVDASKIPYGRFMAQEAINDALVTHARAGRFVVRLKGGDPYVFGRGYEEVQACAAAGVPVTVVPGISSAISVPSAAGVPVTHRGVTHEFVVVSGHLRPDHPDSLVNWAALAALKGTLVLLMAVERAAEFADVLIRGGRPPGTPAVVVQEGTTRTERVVSADLSTLGARIREEGIRPPAVIVIGAVAGFVSGTQ